MQTLNKNFIFHFKSQTWLFLPFLPTAGPRNSLPSIHVGGGDQPSTQGGENIATAGTAATMASYWPPPLPQISLVWASQCALHTAPKTLSQEISPLSAMVPYCAQITGERTLQVIKPTGLGHCARLGQGSPPRLGQVKGSWILHRDLGGEWGFVSHLELGSRLC